MYFSDKKASVCINLDTCRSSYLDHIKRVFLFLSSFLIYMVVWSGIRTAWEWTTNTNDTNAIAIKGSLEGQYTSMILSQLMHLNYV